jgi:hypothetical protein
MIVYALRGQVKSAGGRLPACSTEFLPGRALAAIPPALSAVATPLVEQIGLLNAQVDGMDKQIAKLSAKYPEIVLLRTARPAPASAPALNETREKCPRSPRGHFPMIPWLTQTFVTACFCRGILTVMLPK